MNATFSSVHPSFGVDARKGQIKTPPKNGVYFFLNSLMLIKMFFKESVKIFVAKEMPTNKITVPIHQTT
jgi:hypothetical protein